MASTSAASSEQPQPPGQTPETAGQPEELRGERVDDSTALRRKRVDAMDTSSLAKLRGGEALPLALEGLRKNLVKMLCGGHVLPTRASYLLSRYAGGF